MASSTFNLNKSSGTSYIVGKIVWSSAANNSGNYSLCDADLYVRKDNDTTTLTEPTYGIWSYSLSFGGVSTSGTVQKSVLTSWVKVASLSDVKVTHDDDGSKSASISGSVTAPSGTSFAGKVTSKSGTVDLDNIPRASTISSAPNATIGNKCSIKWTPASSSFRYKIKFSMGSWSYTTGAIHPNQTSAYTYSGYTIPLSCADQYASGWASGTMTATLYTYSDSACTKSVGSSSAKTFTVTLPGASTITSASDTTLGNKLSVKFTPKNSSYRYKVKLTISGTDYSYTSSAIAPSTTAAYTYGVTLGIGTIAPYVTSKTGTMTATLTTYRDSNCTKVVGSSDSETFTVTVPDSSATRPTVTMTLSAVNSGLSSTFDGLYIQGKSKVKAAFSVTPKYDATVKSRVMNVDSKNYSSSPWQSALLNTAGSRTVTGTVTDSRDHKGTDTESITVIPYSVPLLKPVSGKKAIVCGRYNGSELSETGTQMWVEMQRVYSPVTAENVQKNFCTVQYRWKTTDGEFNSWHTLLGKTDTTNTIQKSVHGVCTDTKKSYEVEFRAVDDIGSVSPTVTAYIPTDEVTFHLGKGGKRVAVGKWSEPKYNASGKEIPHFEVPDGWSTYLRGPVYGNVYGLAEAETTIEEGQDFDNIIDFGVYSIPSNAIAKTLLNCPVPKAGKLIVSSATATGDKDGDWVYILQEYISYDGSSRCRRTRYTKDDGNWYSYKWEHNSSLNWQDLGLYSDVSAPETSVGRTPYNCAYRVENNNHVYVAFQCAFEYTGDYLRINNTAIPEGLRPGRYIYGLCAVGGKYIARVSVNTAGSIFISWVQNLTSGSETTSVSIPWIDGYIDYWI